MLGVWKVIVENVSVGKEAVIFQGQAMPTARSAASCPCFARVPVTPALVMTRVKALWGAPAGWLLVTAWARTLALPSSDGPSWVVSTQPSQVLPSGEPECQHESRL